MGTSSSPDDEWTCTVVCMSGRADPSWALSTEDRDGLIARWATLSPARDVAPLPPPLGYRGCIVTGAGERWFAYAGVVQRTRGSNTETRQDHLRSVEHALIDSARDPSLRQLLTDIARGGSRS